MTLQEIADKVVAGLASQGFRQSRDGKAGDCLYRGDGGMKCAAGHLIPDSCYRPEMEYHNIKYVANFFSLGSFDLNHLNFVSELQRAHDNAIGPENMKERLRNLLIENNLQIPEALR